MPTKKKITEINKEQSKPTTEVLSNPTLVPPTKPVPISELSNEDVLVLFNILNSGTVSIPGNWAVNYVRLQIWINKLAIDRNLAVKKSSKNG